MKTNLKLVAGSVAGLLTAVGLVVGLIAWASAEGSSGSVATTDAGAASAAEPIESPSLEAELATTHRAAATRSAPPEPVLVEDEPPVDPFEPELDPSGDARVERLIVATGIRGHEPTGASDELVLGEQSRFYAFVHAVNDGDDDAELYVTFEPEAGESAGHVALDIPANRPRYRTWAWTRHVYTPGRWHVVVRAADGHVVARRAFDVVE